MMKATYYPAGGRLDVGQLGDPQPVWAACGTGARPDRSAAPWHLAWS